MAKLFIGIDIDADKLRMVSLEESGNGLKPVAITQRKLAPDDEAAEVVATIVGEWDASNARLAMALPAGKMLSRHLAFPFGERKKIAAAIPLELGSRLPNSLDNYVITSLPPVAEDKLYQTIGLALPQELVASTLAPFDQLQLPLRQLTVTPFAYAGRFSDQPENCILVSIRTTEIATLIVKDNKPLSHRTSIRSNSQTTTETAEQISIETLSLQKSAGFEDLPIYIFGPGLDADLQRAVSTALPTARVPEERFNDERLQAEFLPALALARLAAAPEQSCNLRQGAFAFRGSLAPFKKQLIAAAILLSMALTGLIGGAWISYTTKATAVQSLQKQMEAIFSQTFPGAGDPPKDIPLHMTSRLNGARNQNQLLGGPGVAPLAVLEAIARAFPTSPENVIKELNYDENGIRLSGQTSSFDAVDQLAASLNRETAFNSARISDAKTNIDGKRIDFRIDLGFAGKGGQP